MNLIPLCSYQYKRLFGTCRIPGKEQGIVYMYNEVIHVHTCVYHIIIEHMFCPYYKGINMLYITYSVFAKIHHLRYTIFMSGHYKIVNINDKEGILTCVCTVVMWSGISFCC